MSKVHRRRTKTFERLSRRPAIARRGEHAITDALLQPWFLNKAAAHAVQRLIPLEYISRMRWHFDDYGCLGCKRKKVLYSANGLCVDCRSMIERQLVQSMKRRAKTVMSTKLPKPHKGYLTRVAAAEQLLREFVQERPKRIITASVLAPEAPTRSLLKNSFLLSL